MSRSAGEYGKMRSSQYHGPRLDVKPSMKASSGLEPCCDPSSNPAASTGDDDLCNLWEQHHSW